MLRTWAVARHMIAESIRTRVAVLFIALLLVVLGVGPFVIVGDGVTLTSKVQSVLAYSLGVAGFLLSLLTVFLACGGLANEVQTRQMFMVASKPIPRWQFFLGKWLGIVVLNAVLLGITYAALLTSVAYLKRQPTAFEADRSSLQNEVLTVRHGYNPVEPDWDRLADERIRQYREQGVLDEMNLQAEQGLRARVIRDLQLEWRSLAPRAARRYEFRNLLVDREKDVLSFRFEPSHPGGSADTLFLIRWAAGDLANPKTLTNEHIDEYIAERFHSFQIPASAVNDQGTLYVMVQNLTPNTQLNFEGDDNIELMNPISNFSFNTLMAVALIWTRLAFLAIVGLTLSSAFSFPVACMACLLVLAVGSGAGWLRDSLQWIERGPTGDEPLGLLGGLIRPLAYGFVWLVPNFAVYDGATNVVNGRLVPLMWVIQALLMLVVIRGAILALIGIIVFTKRELAKVVV